MPKSVNLSYDYHMIIIWLSYDYHMIIICITILVGLKNFTGSSIFWGAKKWAVGLNVSIHCQCALQAPPETFTKVPIHRHRVARGQRKVQTELLEWQKYWKWTKFDRKLLVPAVNIQSKLLLIPQFDAASPLTWSLNNTCCPTFNC